MTKIVIVGDAGVGKTNLVRILKELPFEKRYFATKGAEVHPYFMNTTIWDIAGNPEYAGARESYLKDADIAIIMQDVNRNSTLENAHNYWIPMLTTSKIIMVGNKSAVQGEDLMSLKEGFGIIQLIMKIASNL